MKMRWFIVMSLALMIPHPIQAQQETDRIIAGEHLVRLWDAITVKKVKIESSELKDLIIKRHLSAILIPKDQPADKRIIKKCYKVKTVFDIPDMEVSADDHTQLLKYAKDGVFERASAVRDAILNSNSQQFETATTSLNVFLNAQTGSEKEASQKFAGALLADLEPSKAELASLVNDFRTHVEKDTASRLRLAAFISPRTPYAVSAFSFSTVDLFKINPSTVRQLTIDGKTYRAAWVGETYLLSLQDTSPTPRDPTGLGLSETWLAATATSTKAASVKYAVRFEF